MRNNTASATTAIVDPRVGRFAPSPTGPLHAGSLLAAVGSWLDARASGGRWTIRIDDLDPQRCREHFVTLQVETLAAFGLKPFGFEPTLWRQSTRQEAYADALARLSARVAVFTCDCTRRERSQEAESGCLRDCRQRRPPSADAALRADLTSLNACEVQDRSLGPIRFDPYQQRDVIVRRRDGAIAYALAVVVDDAAQGITDVVRGGDLLEGTRWQLGLHQALGLHPPKYLHLPVLVEADGHKLAKSRHAIGIDPSEAPRLLRQTLRQLGQSEPPDSRMTSASILDWAAEHWRPEQFAGVAIIPTTI